MIENISNPLVAARIATACARVMEQPYWVLRTNGNTFVVVSKKELDTDGATRKLKGCIVEDKVVTW